MPHTEGVPAADAWVAQIHQQAEADDNDLLADVGDCYQYLLDHRDDWSSDIEPGDLPAFDDHHQWLIKRTVGFGTYLLAARSEVHVVTGSRQRFVGVYGDAQNARDRVRGEDAMVAETVVPEGRVPQALIDPMLETGDDVAKAGECLQVILDEADRFTKGAFDPADLPHGDTDMRWLIVLSVLFGMLWEGSYPGLLAVLGLNERYHGLYNTHEAAREAATGHRNRFAQAVTVADGAVGPGELLAHPPQPEVDR